MTSQKYRNLTFRFLTSPIRNLFFFLKLHPTSGEYITGDGFRKIANHIYDENSKINIEKIKINDIIFVKSNLIDKYFQDIHPFIQVKYKLITHNSDKNIGEREVKYIDDKIIKWFAQNVEMEHPKLIPIPIGIENKKYFYNGIPYIFNKIKNTKTTKKDKIIFGFNIMTNPQERQSAFSELINNNVVEQINGFPNPYNYIKILNQYKFVASPPGNGIDCHRTWEAMYLNVIPIVKHSVMTEYFKNLGLPLWIINDWKELDGLTENDLSDKYEDIMTNSKTEPLFMNYWKEKINNI